MAKLLLLNSANGEPDAVDLRLGVNRLGRAAQSDVQLAHQTVSTNHCEIVLGCGEITVRDCDSTNGTFLDGVPVRAAPLKRGQRLRLGDVELLVAETDLPIGIPQFETTPPTRAISMTRVSAVCCRHIEKQADYHCSHCGDLLCVDCIHRLRRRGGNLLCLCPHCSYPVEAVSDKPKKRRSFLQRLREITRIVFSRAGTKN